MTRVTPRLQAQAQFAAATMRHPPSSLPGVLHHIPPISAFEPTTTSSIPPNLLIWIGGLTDTYHSVSYPYRLAQKLPQNWGFAQVNLSSAGQGWGTASLGQDVSEISKIVKYFRTYRAGKIVLMGHSTGCQDCVHYLCSEGHRAPVDGIIIQAPVSDREAMEFLMPKHKIEAANKIALKWVEQGKEEDCLPMEVVKGIMGNCPVTARRWLSLSSPDGTGEDDYFSSDLPDERLQNTFGRVKVPLLILYGEKDEFVPGWVDKKALVRKWVKVVRDNGGKVDGKSEELLGGATHNLNGDPDEVVEELIKRVQGFLAGQGAKL